MSDPTLRDETALSWNFLEDEHDPCFVVSERMELAYINGAAQQLVPEEWFGNRAKLERTVLGVGLIPLGADRADHARAVFVLRAKDTSGEAHAFESQLLPDAERVRERVLSKLPVTS